MSGEVRYKFVFDTNHRGTAYPRHIRDTGGIVVTFPAPHYWDGQQERYDAETKDLFRVAETVLAALNAATPPGTEAVPEGTVELLGKICARFREIEYQHELNQPHIGDGVMYEMLEDLSNTLTDPVRIVPEAEYQRMRKAAKGPA